MPYLNFKPFLMKHLPQMVLFILASTVLISCNTAKYTVTDGVYYNPKKDKEELNYAMGYAEPEYTVVDNTKNNSGFDDSARPNNVYKEVDTITYAGNNGTIINNNYYGDYYDYDDDDFRYTRRINNIYYPPTAPRVTYYSSWSRYGGNGVYCNTYYYDPWWGYDPYYSYYDPWYGYSVSYRYGYSNYNYYNWNNCYSCGNTYNYYNYGCGNIYNPCGGNRNNGGNWGNNSNNNSEGNRWTGPEYGPGPGPINTLYARGTTPGNGLKRDLPERHEVRNGNSERLNPNGGGRAAELSNKEKPAFAGGNVEALGKVLPKREKTVIRIDEVIVASNEGGNDNMANEFKPKKDEDLPERGGSNTYYTLKTSPNSTINPHGGAITKTTVVNGNTKTTTGVNTRTLPGRSNTTTEVKTTNVSTRTNSGVNNTGSSGNNTTTRTTNTYRPRSNTTYTPAGSNNTPSGTNVRPRSSTTKTNVSPRTTPSRTNVSPRTTPSRTNVSPRTTPTRTRSNNTYTPSRSGSSPSGGSSRSGSSGSSKSGSSKSLPKR